MTKTGMFKRTALMVMAVVCAGMLTIPGMAMAAEGDDLTETTVEVTAPVYNATKKITVTYNANGGTFVDRLDPTKTAKTVKKIYEESVTDLDILEDYDVTPPKEGKELDGWYDRATGGTVVDPAEITGTSKTVYAHWRWEEGPLTTGFGADIPEFGVGDEVTFNVKYTKGHPNKYEFQYTLDETITDETKWVTFASGAITGDEEKDGEAFIVKKKVKITKAFKDYKHLIGRVTDEDGQTDTSGNGALKFVATSPTVTYTDDTLTDKVEYTTNGMMKLTVDAKDGSGFKYQWMYTPASSIEELEISGQTKFAISVKMTPANREKYDGGKIWCRVTNDEGGTTDSTKLIMTPVEATVTNGSITLKDGTPLDNITVDSQLVNGFEFVTKETVDLTVSMDPLSDIIPKSTVSYTWSYLPKGQENVEKNWKSCGTKKDLSLKMTRGETYDGAQFRCTVRTSDEKKVIGPVYAKWRKIEVAGVAFKICSISPTGELTNNADFETNETKAFVVTSFKVDGVSKTPEQCIEDGIPVKYQWKWAAKLEGGEYGEFKEFSGGKKAEMRIKLNKKYDGAKFKCIVSYTGEGSVESGIQSVTWKPAAINDVVMTIDGEEMVVGNTAQTFDYNVSTATAFKVTAKSNAKIKSYQWEWSADGTTWQAIPGGTKASFSKKLTADDNGKYIRCVIKNAEDSEYDTYGDTHKVTAKAEKTGVPITAVSITPGTVKFTSGSTKTLTVKATSKKKIEGYQWKVLKENGDPENHTDANWDNVEGATKATLKINKTTDSGKTFSCEVNNGDTTEWSGNYVVIPSVYDASFEKELDIETKLLNRTSVKLTRVNSSADEVALPAEVEGSDDTMLLTMIAGGAFKGYKGSVIEIPETVTKIAKDAFSGTTGIETVKLAVKDPTKFTVAKDAFAGLADGTTVEITASDRNQFKRVVSKIERSGAKNLVFKFVAAE